MANLVLEPRSVGTSRSVLAVSDQPVDAIIRVTSPKRSLTVKEQIRDLTSLKVRRHNDASEYYSGYDNMSHWLRNLLAIVTFLCAAAIVTRNSAKNTGLNVLTLVLSALLALLTLWSSWVQPGVRAAAHASAAARYKDLLHKIDVQKEASSYTDDDLQVAFKLLDGECESLEPWMCGDDRPVWHVSFSRQAFVWCGCCCAPLSRGSNEPRRRAERARKRRAVEPPRSTAPLPVASGALPVSSTVDSASQTL